MSTSVVLPGATRANIRFSASGIKRTTNGGVGMCMEVEWKSYITPIIWPSPSHSSYSPTVSCICIRRTASSFTKNAPCQFHIP
ncbi:hypothetical protein ACFSKU_10230 [Pontibacter silvestris]|uniref:Uncharacterized protein n=1 Tax=Pontibacter silvestris TaxID=2305183 RepID=A0ABW4WYD9_9BACT|nr:hypothetical protein [Pontibacter silvestris]MCC9136784.1 hypothetical protein [Pontibacter silvestris]